MGNEKKIDVAKVSREKVSQNRFNLVDDKWIPVNVGNELYSLIDVFEKQSSFTFVAGKKMEKNSLFRFIFTIFSHVVNSVMDLKTKDELNAADNGEIAGKCMEFLKENRDRFYLYYGETPFLQYPCLEKKFNDANIPDNSTGTHFDFLKLLGLRSNGTQAFHEVERIDSTPTDPEIAMYLIQIAGNTIKQKGVYENTVSIGQLKGGFTKISQGSAVEAGTLFGCSSRGCFSAFIESEGGFIETLKMNAITECELMSYGEYENFGTPVFLDMPKEEYQNGNNGWDQYLKMLFPLDRAFLLTDNGIIKSDLNSYDSSFSPLGIVRKSPFIVTYSTIDKDKRSFHLVPDTNKDPIRELPAIILGNSDMKKSKTLWTTLLETIEGYRDWQEEGGKKIKLNLYGIQTSVTMGEMGMKDDDGYIESSFVLTPMNSSEALVKFKETLNLVENANGTGVANILRSKIYKYYKSICDEAAGKNTSKVMYYFYEMLNRHLKDAFYGIEDLYDKYSDNDIETLNLKLEEFENSFYSICRNCAIETYEECCKRNSGKRMSEFFNNFPGYACFPVSLSSFQKHLA